MPIQTACSSCSAKLKVKDELLGKSIKCPKCAQVFKVNAGSGEEKSSLRAGAATQTAPKKPPAAWDSDDEDAGEEEKASPWDKKAAAKKGRDDDKKTPAKKGPPAKNRVAEDDDDDDDDDDQEEAAFADLLNQTQLPDSTKKMIKNELGLREQGFWVGQPDVKIMTVRAIPKAIGVAFVFTVIGIGLSIGAVTQFKDYALIVIPAMILLFLVLCALIGAGIMMMDARKARATAYVITNKRCIVFTGRWFGNPGTESFYPDLLQHMRRMGSWVFGGDAGDLVFRSVTTITTTHHQRGGSSTSVSTTYFGFLGVRNLDAIERMIREALLSDDDDDDDEEDEEEAPRKKKKKR